MRVNGWVSRVGPVGSVPFAGEVAAPAHLLPKCHSRDFVYSGSFSTLSCEGSKVVHVIARLREPG